METSRGTFASYEEWNQLPIQGITFLYMFGRFFLVVTKRTQIVSLNIWDFFTFALPGLPVCTSLEYWNLQPDVMMNWRKAHMSKLLVSICNFWRDWGNFLSEIVKNCFCFWAKPSFNHPTQSELETRYECPQESPSDECKMTWIYSEHSFFITQLLCI